MTVLRNGSGMGEDAALQAGEAPRRAYLFGPCTALGGAVAALACALDQGAKLFLVFDYDLANRGLVPLAPGLDLVLAWNTGISYGLLRQDGEAGRWLLVGFKLAAIALLWIWLARARSRALATALGLIVGGALGNTIDRVTYGAVADFLLLRLDAMGLRFPYIFNLADVAITLGVVLMLADALFASRAAAKAP